MLSTKDVFLGEFDGHMISSEAFQVVADRTANTL